MCRATLRSMPFAPMLACPGAAIPAPPGEWAFEPKWDGMRTIVSVDADLATRLVSRTGKVWTDAFPELADLGRVVGRPVVLDGETIVLGDDGRPSFERLSWRLRAPRPAIPPRRCPATFVAFDVLALDGEVVTDRPWSKRRALLETLSLDGPAAVATMVVDDGAALFAATGALGVEGIIAKRRSARYVCGPRRTRAWLKIKHRASAWMDVAGWRPPTRSQPAGAILLARDGQRAGSALPGLPGDQREVFHRFVQRHGTPAGPVVRVPYGAQVRVDYTERSATGLLREAVARE